MARFGLVKGYMTASKSRNLMTQEITDTSFDGDVTNRNVLVVDDICDGGRTFIQLGKKLREQGCKELSLLVTHGIFSYGVDELMKIYDRVYTTDSFHPDEYSEIRQYTKNFTNDSGISRFYWFQA
jgi:ribose-phosphate pyrophosphokinase